MQQNPNVIGDFTWTGWDYLGEADIGANGYAQDPEAQPGLAREFPWLTAATTARSTPTGRRRATTHDS
jgi:beta-galactosidase